MASAFLPLALAAAALPTAAPDAGAAADPFRSLFPDWDAIARESLSREQAAAEAGPPAVPPAEARALGDRVGRIVAEGDCAEGERIAREAGDFALLEAVRNHCRIAMPGGPAPSGDGAVRSRGR